MSARDFPTPTYTALGADEVIPDDIGVSVSIEPAEEIRPGDFILICGGYTYEHIPRVLECLVISSRSNPNAWTTNRRLTIIINGHIGDVGLHQKQLVYLKRNL